MQPKTQLHCSHTEHEQNRIPTKHLTTDHKTKTKTIQKSQQENHQNWMKLFTMDRVGFLHRWAKKSQPWKPSSFRSLTLFFLSLSFFSKASTNKNLYTLLGFYFIYLYMCIPLSSLYLSFAAFFPSLFLFLSLLISPSFVSLLP